MLTSVTLRTQASFSSSFRGKSAAGSVGSVGSVCAGGVELTPDVWDRLEADRRQALEDDLAWIREGRDLHNQQKDKR